MSNIILNSPAYGIDNLTVEISAEAETMVDLATNPTSRQSVLRFKLLYAAAITQAKLIPLGEPVVGNAESVISGLLASLKTVVKLAESAPSDF